jgi:hypothetical protein
MDGSKTSADQCVLTAYICRIGQSAKGIEQDLEKHAIGFKIKILDALSVVNVRRVRLPLCLSFSHVFRIPPCGMSLDSRTAS